MTTATNTDARPAWQHTVVKTFATAPTGYPAFNQEKLQGALKAIGVADSAITHQTQEIAPGVVGLPHVRHQVVVSWNGNTNPEAVHAAMNIELYEMGFGENPGQWVTALYDAPQAAIATNTQRG